MATSPNTTTLHKWLITSQKHFPVFLSATFLLTFGYSTAWAVSSEVAQEKVKPIEDFSNANWLDTSQAITRNFSYRLVREVDSWFGDKPFDQSGGRISGYVRINTLWDQRDGRNANLRFRLYAKLPNLQNKAYAFVGQDNEEDEKIDQPENFRRERNLAKESRKRDQSFFAGVGYQFKDNLSFRLGMLGGLNPYAQAQYSYNWNLNDHSLIHFRESIFFSRRDNLGSTTVLDYEHTLSNTLLFRWANVGTITRRSSGFEWQSSVGLLRSFGDLRMLTGEALVQGKAKYKSIANYGFRASWEQPIYKNWIIGKISIGHFWPKDDNGRHRASWSVGLSAEMRY